MWGKKNGVEYKLMTKEKDDGYDFFTEKSLYQLYVDFETKYKRWVLWEHLQTKLERKAFLKNFCILREKPFYSWFDTLPFDMQQNERQKWHMGFTKWLQQTRTALKRILQDPSEPPADLLDDWRQFKKDMGGERGEDPFPFEE